MLATFVLLLWVPGCLLAYALVPPKRWHRAIVATYLVGFFFLPQTSLPIPGLPDYTRQAAIFMAVLAGAILFDAGRLLTYRPRLYDIPMVLFCLAPGLSSISNELGIWDASSEVFDAAITWGLPYLIGRIYFNNAEAFRDLAVGFVAVCIIYVPMCIWEMRMSPQIHNYVYGFKPRGSLAKGGFFPFHWKPAVFMANSFFVGMVFAVSVLFASAMAWGKVRRSVLVVPIFMLVPGLVFMTLMTKMWSAVFLMLVGLGLLIWTKTTRTRIALYLCMASVPLYMAARTTGGWSGEILVGIVEPLSERKAESLKTRLENEDQLAAKGLERPVFGWAAWGRGRIYSDYDGRDLSRTDGLWVIFLNENGLFGLTSYLMVILVPLWLFARTVPPDAWFTKAIAPIAAMAVAVMIHLIDMIPNAFAHPVFYIGAGGLVAFSLNFKAAQIARSHAARRAATRSVAVPGHTARQA